MDENNKYQIKKTLIKYQLIYFSFIALILLSGIYGYSKIQYMSAKNLFKISTNELLVQDFRTVFLNLDQFVSSQFSSIKLIKDNKIILSAGDSSQRLFDFDISFIAINGLKLVFTVDYTNVAYLICLFLTLSLLMSYHINKYFTRSFQQQLDAQVLKQKSNLILELSQQVAHDIRSPLSTMNMLLPSLSQDTSAEKCEMLLFAAKRIDKIAEDLLAKGRSIVLSNVVTVKDLEIIIIEKRILLASQSKKISIELIAPESFSFNTKIAKIEIERIVSNLLNNAIDAIPQNKDGLVTVGLKSVDHSTVLFVKDNGMGMDQEKLSKVGTKGFTSGKASGNGLGLYHAKTTIEAAGGHFSVYSQLGSGTTVNLKI